VRIPENKSFIEAAAFPLAYATAAAMLRKADLKAGETVLVVGASGGLGYAGIQLAKALGARVIAVVRQQQHVEPTLAIGADVVLQAGPDLVERVKQLTGGQGVDVAFEHVGPATFTASLACMRLDGRLVTAGVTTGTEAPLDLKSVFLKRLSIMGCRGSGQTDLRLVVKLWEEGKIAPRVDYVLPLADAAEAHRIMEQGSRFGKIVLEV
jgi:NADPH:quinone reductase-like Zn-dependent oxidoreductase